MEAISAINKRLLDHYGRFEDGRANWRVVWSDDQLEKRWVTSTDEGFLLSSPMIAEVPKYSYIQHRYILERLVPVADFMGSELVDKTSYEPIWTFQDNEGNALPPIWETVFLLVRQVQENMGNAGHNAPYKAPYGMGNTLDEVKMRVEKLQEQLFGNETKIGDALAYDTAVGYGKRDRSDWVN